MNDLKTIIKRIKYASSPDKDDITVVVDSYEDLESILSGLKAFVLDQAHKSDKLLVLELKRLNEAVIRSYDKIEIRARLRNQERQG